METIANTDPQVPATIRAQLLSGHGITRARDPLARLRRQVSEVKSRVAGNNHLSQTEIAAGVDAMAANFG